MGRGLREQNPLSAAYLPLESDVRGASPRRHYRARLPETLNRRDSTRLPNTMKSWRENPDGEENQRATKQIEREVGGLKLAAVLELGHAKSNDAHCLACGFKMLGGADVGLCPKCGSDRWYKTRL